MNIHYLGHSCLLVESNNTRVIIDPFLTGNPNAALKQEDVNVEAVLITHGHSDHIGDAVAIAKRNDCPIITNFEIAMYLAKQGVKVHPMHIGGSFTFEWGIVKLTLAFHGSGIEVGEGDFVYGGNPAGILLTMNGRTLYHAGDTALFGDMKLLGELNTIDVAALPIGDNFTMGIEDATIAAKMLGTKTVIPIHYNTFPLINSDPHTFAASLKEVDIHCAILQPGEHLNV
jgi:L-ascorbate metabolism protein UlaG (beta-lactamase superfamily)